MTDSPPPSSPAPFVRPRNAPTLTAAQVGQWMQRVSAPGQAPQGQLPAAVRGVALADAYEQALRMHALRERLPFIGHRIFCVTERTIVCRDLSADGEHYLVVGRHTSCDLVVEGDPTLSLRHLLVRSRPLDDGCPTLSVLDLQTELGFLLDNGSRQRSISAAGPIALRVGSTAIIALPSTGTLAASLPEAVREAVPLATAAPQGGSAAPSRAPGRAPEPDAAPRATPVRRPAVSYIKLLPPACVLSERPHAWGTAAPSDAPPAYAVTVTGPHGSAQVHVTEEEAARGILVGRAPRCVAAFGAALHGGISRVHLLLVKEADRCTAYDLASMQGTYGAGVRVRAVALDDRGSILDLGTAPAIRLRWSAL